MVSNCHQTTTNPSATVKEIEAEVSRVSWIYAALCDKDQTMGMSLEQIKYMLLHVKTWGRSRIQQAIKDYKVCNLVEKTQVVVSTANIFVDTQK